MKVPDRFTLDFLLGGPEGLRKLDALAESVRQGAVFVYPTETVYGVGGACDVDGVKEKVRAAKARPSALPFILLASDRRFFGRLPLAFPPAAERLAARFWPGRLTLILPSDKEPGGTAVRVSPHPFIRAFFSRNAAPLYSTSANLSGQAYVNDPDLIFSLFLPHIDFMIDAGALPHSLPSTVVRITADNAVSIVREGAVSTADIYSAL